MYNWVRICISLFRTKIVFIMRQVIFAILLLYGLAICAQTVVPGGTISGTWTKAGSPYLIQDDVWIPSSSQLTIEPGVDVIFDDCFYFDVYGTLTAIGLENDSIRFTVADTTGYFSNSHLGWYGIFFEESYSNNLEYLILEFSKSNAIYLIYSGINISNSAIIYNGGGIGIYDGDDSTFDNLVISNNGSGIYISVGTQEDYDINNCIIENNSGVGIVVQNYNDLDLSNSLIKNNTGGGVSVSYESSLDMDDCIIDGNGGAGLSIAGYCSVSNTIIKNNTALNGGGIACSMYESKYFSGVTLENNIALEKGGGIYHGFGSTKLSFNGIISNNSAQNGGGIYIEPSSPFQPETINISAEISSNYAEFNGGGIYNSTDGNSNCPIYYNHVTLVNNIAGQNGGGIYNQSFDITSYVISSILWDNSPEDIDDQSALLDITYTDVGATVPGIGNINADPLFTNPGAGDYHLSWVNYPIEDYTKSPCIGTGLNSADMGKYNFSIPPGQHYSLDLKLALEGPFFSLQMTPYLNLLGFLPLYQPYDREPWNYSGSDTVASIPNISVVDWIYIEIRKQQDIYNQDTNVSISRQAAFLLANGSIVGLDGNSLLHFYTNETDSLHICVYHRNHLPIVSFHPIEFSNDTILYDFTQSEYMVVGGNHSQKELSPGIWGMIAADGNANGQIDNLDKDDIWLIETGNIGYYDGDYNLDGQVNETDIAFIWEINSGKGKDWSIDDNFIWNCGIPIYDFRDGQMYNTVQIGDQCWMAENLNYDFGTSFCYENQPSNCETYGRIYSSGSANNACPSGWHLPDYSEWEVLVDYLGGNSIAGGKMKSMGTLQGGTGLWIDPNIGATNESSFSALPGGYYIAFSTIGNFFDINESANFWTSTTYIIPHVYRLSLFNSNTTASFGTFEEWDGASVRCIKDL